MQTDVTDRNFPFSCACVTSIILHLFSLTLRLHLVCLFPFQDELKTALKIGMYMIV